MYKLVVFDLDDTLYSTKERIDSVTPNFATMKLADGARELLEKLKCKKILLTHGLSEMQNKKIDTLCIRNLFDEIIIVPANAEKLLVFEKIRKDYSDPKEVAVVGDRRDVEIRFGNTQGFTTILVDGFKYKDLAPKDDLEKPTHEIKQFSDLIAILGGV